MERPYGISDFAFPTQWDRESGPDLVERAGQGSRGGSEESERVGYGFDIPKTVIAPSAPSAPRKSGVESEVGIAA